MWNLNPNMINLMIINSSKENNLSSSYNLLFESLRVLNEKFYKQFNKKRTLHILFFYSVFDSWLVGFKKNLLLLSRSRSYMDYSINKIS